jgi:dGTPase
VQFLDRIEDQDLTMQVLDGILCHNGEADDLRIKPAPCGSWAAFDKKVQDNADGRRSGASMTLEGCVVKFADTIAYIGRDIQDAREIGLIDDSIPLPEKCTDVLGCSNREIINTLIYDLLENSDSEDEGYIAYSRDVEEALIGLRHFSRTHIYENEKLTSERLKIGRMYATLFESCLKDLESGKKNTKIVSDFIAPGWISPRYLEMATDAELVRDFIAGMTDRYFAKRFEECVIPRRTEAKFS